MGEPDYSDPALTADLPHQREPLGTLPSRRCRLTRARIEPLSDWQFQFIDTNDCGFVAEILVVRSWHDELVELIAWEPRQPGRWWLRVGDFPLLGHDLAELALIRKEPIWLAETPAEWFALLKQGCEAVVAVANWHSDPRFVLTGLNLHTSPAMARRVRQWWADHNKMHFKLTVEGARRAA